MFSLFKKKNKKVYDCTVTQKELYSIPDVNMTHFDDLDTEDKKEVIIRLINNYNHDESVFKDIFNTMMMVPYNLSIYEEDKSVFTKRV